jgi:hypothetical protein
MDLDPDSDPDPDPDADLDPSIFVIDLQDAYKKLLFLVFLLITFSKEVTIKVFLTIFAW